MKSYIVLLYLKKNNVNVMGKKNIKLKFLIKDLTNAQKNVSCVAGDTTTRFSPVGATQIQVITRICIILLPGVTPPNRPANIPCC